MRSRALPTQAVARATASAETALKVASEGITKGIQGVLPDSKVSWPLHVDDVCRSVHCTRHSRRAAARLHRMLAGNQPAVRTITRLVAHDSYAVPQ